MNSNVHINFHPSTKLTLSLSKIGNPSSRNSFLNFMFIVNENFTRMYECNSATKYVLRKIRKRKFKLKFG